MLDNASSNKNWRYLTNSTDNVHKQCDSSKYGGSVQSQRKNRNKFIWLY